MPSQPLPVDYPSAGIEPNHFTGIELKPGIMSATIQNTMLSNTLFYPNIDQPKSQKLFLNMELKSCRQGILGFGTMAKMTI
jgi:hypothetical protein